MTTNELKGKKVIVPNHRRFSVIVRPLAARISAIPSTAPWRREPATTIYSPTTHETLALK